MNKPTAVVLSASEDWKFSWNWSNRATLYHNGPSEQLFDMERAIDLLILDIRAGRWPKELAAAPVPATSTTNARLHMVAR